MLAAGALVAAPALVPATSSAGGTAASTALSLVSPDVAEAKKKTKKKKKSKKASKKAKAKAAKATKSEYKKIKRGMTLAQVRKIIGSKGKRSWYYESTSTDSQCDDGYWTDGHYEPTETWIEGYYDWNGNWVDGQIEYGETWVDGEWIDGTCWDEDLTTVYSDHNWKNNKGGYVYVSFTDGRVDSKSWYS